MIWVENQDLNKLDMDVEDAKKISVKFALCDFKMKSDVIKKKRKLWKQKFYHKVNNYMYVQSKLKPWTSLAFSNSHSF